MARGGVVARLKHLNGLAWHDRRNGVLIDKLGMAVAPKKHAKIVKPRDNTL
jgi:hypothetical protein